MGGGNTLNTEYILTPDGELYHWKYIRKERRPNGKWRYYYKDDALDEAHTQRLRAAGEHANAITAASDSYKRATDLSNRKRTRDRKQYHKDAKRYIETSEKLSKAERNYNKQKVKDLPRKIISKGAVYLANLFSDLID